jgi:hypothetical protein
MKRSESNEINAAAVIGVIGAPLLAVAVATIALFYHQSSLYASEFFQGNWQTLMQIVLWFEAFLPTVVLGIQALVIGAMIPEAAGFGYSFLEGVICLGITGGIFGWGFWWLLTSFSSLLGLGGNAIASGLIVYLFLLPICLGLCFLLAIIANAAVTILIEPKDKD